MTYFLWAVVDDAPLGKQPLGHGHKNRAEALAEAFKQMILRAKPIECWRDGVLIFKLSNKE